MLKLKRLEILRYRNVEPGTELRFDDGLNVILGQSASGKATLLALLSAVCRSAFKGMAHEEFALEYELHGERFTVTAKVSHRPSASVVAGEVFDVDSRWEDDYEVVIEDRSARTRITIDGSGPAAGLVRECSFISTALAKRCDVPAALRTDLPRSFASAYRFDESLDCFSAMVGRPIALPGTALPPTARVSCTEHRRAGRNVVTMDVAFVPQSLAIALRRSFQAGGPARRPLDFGGSERGLLQRLARILDVEDVAITPNLVERRVANGDRSCLVEGFTFEVTRADGTTLQHDRLSYGQKRLLAFAYFLECNPSVVIADELVNGLHHRGIDECMKALAGRQAFLTSQRSLLSDYVMTDSTRCERKPPDTKEHPP